MRLFQLNNDEVELVGAFRLLTTLQRALLLETVLDIATKQQAALVHERMDNVIPLHPMRRE
jgi:hypothetical protein